MAPCCTVESLIEEQRNKGTEVLNSMSEHWMWTEKYRPKKLKEIVGQKPITDRLKKFLVEQDLPHLLFAGPAGTGKTTAILAFANELYGELFTGNFLELNASVTPETPIMIRKDGRVERTNFEELSKIYFVDNEKYAEPSNIEVLSFDDDYKIRFMPVSLISRHKVRKIAKIRYEGGEIRTSLNHSVIIIDEQGNLVSKEVSDLNEGDLLITFRTTIESEEKSLLDFEKYEPQQYNELRSGLVKNPKIKTILRNMEIDKDLAWLFGTYLAEGCLSFNKRGSSGGLVFTFGNPGELDSVERVQTILKNKFGLDSTTNIGYSGFDRSKGSSLQVRVHNTQLARFFRNNFYNGSKKYIAKTKRVPNFIYDSKYRWDFLKGYIHDGSGNWDEYIRYSSRSKQNLIDVSWLGRISGLETSCFDEEARIVWKLPTYSYIRTNLLPAAPIINILKRLNKKSIGFNWRYSLRHQLYSKQSKRLTKKLMKDILSKINDQGDEVQKLKNLTSSPLSVVLIKKIKIEEYNDYVYDVSVPGSEMFWGGKTPILLHNSDDRGIDVIRNRVKNFARTRPLGDVPFKIISLDEADSLTRDAQHALRRTMERFVTSCRFCLICNYSSRIIDPIQSRCAIFRFPRVDEKQLKARIGYIADREEVNLSDDGIQAILYVSGGDLRRAINVLQAAAVIQKKVDADAIYETTGKARPEDINQMISLAFNGKFIEAQEKLRNLLIWQGLSGTDIIRQVHREVMKLGIDETIKVQLVEAVGEAEFRLTEGADPEIQLSYILAKFALITRPSDN